MKRLALFCGVIFLPLLSQAQDSGQKEKVAQTKLDSVVVESFRGGKNTPVTHSTMDINLLKKQSPVSSVPMVLSLMPSVVSSTEGGNGLGYSSLRIRGSESSRINVTLNGIALNDAESQEVFWVNIPSFTSFLQDVQVQRGVGTSTNGPAAFGASINMRTLFTAQEPYGVADFSIGSYNTFLATVGAGSGLLKNGLSFDLRYSRNRGDGYIRNAKTDLGSLFASAGWFKGDNSLKLTYIMGDQKSGITWEGISKEQMESDRKFNSAGSYYDKAGNLQFYQNETDNYIQHHIQAHFIHRISEKMIWSSTIHFTKGDGYYENYKNNRKFSEYDLPVQRVKEIEYTRSDIVIRQALDNNYIALNSSLSYNSKEFNSTAGVTYSYYDGDHFGNLIWSMYDNNIPENHQWYLNKGFKADLSAFARVEKNLGSKVVAFADLQYRRVVFTLGGEDKDFASLDWKGEYNFINPKAGITINIDIANQLYASVAVGRKEPGRSDIKESVKALTAADVKPERVIDYEAGYRYNSKKVALSANLYFMEYKDQLVPTGKLSETGYIIKENVERSFRRGIELSSSWKPITYLGVDANLTLSTNKILNYTWFLDQFDENWNLVSQREVKFDNSHIAFSPSVTGMGMVTLLPNKSSSITVHGKYVGKQYLDNTSNSARSVPQYFVLGLSASKSFEVKSERYLDIQLFIDNILNRRYYSNGWVYSAEFLNGDAYSEEGLYPQAEINFTAKVSFRF
ncbi:MAG: TonB-dependent receptor [Bacteroidetes bacterium HGW-Bacteroidetes-8]|jgi:iron complex outermembrane receptor protein|nr:MAG: TonB-dependent receptor [Bacteroidetes bacterium HGW-Bacteroidetes-8]